MSNENIVKNIRDKYQAIKFDLDERAIVDKIWFAELQPILLSMS